MNRVLLTAALVFNGSLLLSNPSSAQFIPSAKKAAHVRSSKDRSSKLARENLTIIRWITNNPGGSRPSTLELCITERISRS
jgi:hypothetical protein